MYRVRIPIGIALFAVLFGVFWLAERTGTPWPVRGLVALLVVVGIAEMTSMAAVRERSLRAFAILGGGAMMLLPAHAAALAAGSLGAVLVSMMLLGDDPPAKDAPESRPAPHSMVSAAFTALALGYVCLPMLFALRLYEGGWRPVLFAVVVAKGADMGGYLIGKAFGKHKLIPRVSPKKSWEGTIGGVALSIGLAVGLSPELAPDLTRAHAAAFGAVMAPLSLAGDLVESYLKRWAGVKDSGHLIPEYGGVLDLIDSLTLCMPAAYYLMRS